MNYFYNIPFFGTMSAQDQESLSDFCQVQPLSDGQVLFSQGDDAQALYIVQSGNLEVYRQEDGVRAFVAVLGFGDIVGEMSFFGQPPLRNASVVARGDTKVITLLHFSLLQILEKYPNIHEALQKIIQERSQEKI